MSKPRPAALPLGWIAATLGDLVIDGPTNGYSPASSADAAGPFTLRLSATTSGEMLLTPETTKRIHESIPEDSKYWLEGGDLLIQRSNSLEYVGAAAIYDGPPHQYIYPDLMMRVRISDPDVRRFVWRYLNSDAARQYFRSRATGTAGNMPKINSNTVRELPLRVPPVPEQRRILAKLDSILARSRIVKQNLDAMPALIEKLRQATLESAFRRGVSNSHGQSNATTTPVVIGAPPGKPGPGWQWVPLVELAKLESGHTPRKSVTDYWGGDVPWISLRDIRAAHGRTISSTEMMPTKLGIDNSSARVLPAGTVVFSRDISVGYVTIMGRPMATSQHFANWVCGPKLLNRFLMYALMASRSALIRSGEGSTVSTIYMPALERFTLCTPPIDEQSRISAWIDGVFEHIDRLPSPKKLRGSVQEFESSVLEKAFSGELVAQNPEDEPAMKLIERIRHEQQTQKKKPRRSHTRKNQHASPSGGPTMPQAKLTATYLKDIISKHGRAMSPVDLWKASRLEIDDFYSQLKVECFLVGHLRERAPNDHERVIEISK